MSEFISSSSLISLAVLLQNPRDPKAIHSSGPRGRDREGHCPVGSLRSRLPGLLCSSAAPVGLDQTRKGSLHGSGCIKRAKVSAAGGGTPGSSLGLGVGIEVRVEDEQGVGSTG